MDIGIIISIRKVEGDLECEIDFGANQIEEATLYGLSNSNDWPLPGDEVVVSTAGNQNVIVSVHRDTPDGLGAGERIEYGRDSGGNVVSSLHFKSNGEVVINGGTDYAAGYDGLKAGIDQLVSDHNDAVTAINAVASAVPYVIAPPLLPSTASIDSSKVEKVRI